MNIELNRKQLDEITKALAFYFRFLLGQPEYSDELRDIVFENDQMEEYEEWIKQTKKLFFGLERNASFSYKKCPLSYEILGKLQQKQNELDWIKDIRNREPLKCTDEPFIKIID